MNSETEKGTKIAITAMDQNGLESKLDDRFGRCNSFVIVDLVDSKINNYQVIENKDAIGAQGVGISTSETIANKGVEIVITGNIGPNAIRVLQASNIEVYSAPSNITVQEAIQLYVDNKLQLVDTPTVGGHFGQR